MVDFKYKILEWALGCSPWVEEQAEIFLCSGWPAVEHFKCLWYSSVNSDDESQQLTLGVSLAGVKNVC